MTGPLFFTDRPPNRAESKLDEAEPSPDSSDQTSDESAAPNLANDQKDTSKKPAKAAHTEGEPQVTKESTVDSSGNAVAGEKTVYCTVCGAVIRTEKYTLSPEEIEDQFKNSCESPSYEDVARNPDDWKGKKVTFKGKVIQVMQDGNSYTLRVNVTEGRYGIWDDTILVSYKAASGSARILEDDFMSFYGTMNGMYSYQSVMGATITVPLLIASYAD